MGLLAKRDLRSFFEEFVVPYLYCYAYLEKFQTDPWPELDHGVSGLLSDYAAILGGPSRTMCAGYIGLLGLRKRIANKKMCPCSSGRRLGKCHNWKLNAIRSKLREIPRWVFRREAQMLAAEILVEERGCLTVSSVTQNRLR